MGGEPKTGKEPEKGMDWTLRIENFSQGRKERSIESKTCQLETKEKNAKFQPPRMKGARSLNDRRTRLSFTNGS